MPLLSLSGLIRNCVPALAPVYPGSPLTSLLSPLSRQSSPGGPVTVTGREQPRQHLHHQSAVTGPPDHGPRDHSCEVTQAYIILSYLKQQWLQLTNSGDNARPLPLICFNHGFRSSQIFRSIEENNNLKSLIEISLFDYLL